jgi:non-heme chloroperoxidase
MSGHRWLVVLAICGSCRADRPTTTAPWRDASPHTVRMVAIAPGTVLEVLDWGGTGRPLVLLAGLGRTAHIFDDFAPSLTDTFHVYGITRRGFGRSSQPPASDVTTLVSDLRIVLDSLRSSRVILVGHSIAGEELTNFAGSHPDRCAALVYLDAAYDNHSSLLATVMKNFPSPPAMTAADSASPTALAAYVARITGVRVPEADVRAISRFDSSGRYVGDVTSDSLASLIVRDLAAPAYQRLACPSLAIYQSPDSLGTLPWYAPLDSAGRAQAKRVFPMMQAYVRASRTQYQHNAPFSHVVEIRNASHFVFLSNRVQTLSAMRAFLAHAR